MCSTLKYSMKYSIDQEKQQCSFKEIKKSFTKVVDNLESEFKKNNYAYRQKYFDIVEEIIKLTNIVNECYKLILEDEEKIATIFDNPVGMLKYFNELVDVLVKYISNQRQEKKKIKNQTIEILTNMTSERIFETMAKKNLQNYDLKEEVKKMNLQIHLLKEKNKITEEILSSISKTYQENQQENFKLLLSISDLLKKAENNEVELKQNNRLLKELLQSHKIQFERYKTNFKIRDNFNQKEQKIKRIITKKYEEREKIIIKQFKCQQQRDYHYHQIIH